ncbi:DUF3551 domain-containing protein [Bradyrhizobium sp. WSM 1738]|uniref:DUF3551 domain-containing protein n=1 Tax=Bradyrhizobium hereditatis TaxID=2821405 RepID=UPI001CE31A63|nr:DUF3551 domain-containing protein [Bradyrhizobium hereditatis]MCA6116658.1 DUF3551 domain-containing protein [Bradyrhizobium hereditatis]
MRAVFLAFVTWIIVFFTGLSSASAKDYLYCIQGDDFAGGAGECIFATHAQCQAAASGRMASCTENRNLSANAQFIDKSRVRRRSN